MQTIFELSATLATGLFTGAALFISFVEHPAWMELSPSLAVQEFVAAYRRMVIMQPSLAFLGGLGAVLSWWWGASVWWLAGGAAMGSLFPYTAFRMLSINNQLHDPGLDKNPARAMDLLGQWGRRHRIRVLIGLASFLLFLALLKGA
jgi:hypothetical protein